MGLDDALERARGHADAAAARQQHEAQLVARGIARARTAITGLLTDAFARLPAVHPEQVLRPIQRRSLFGSKWEVAERLWRVTDNLIVGSDFAFYEWHAGRGRSVPAAKYFGDKCVLPGQLAIIEQAKPIDVNRHIQVAREGATSSGSPEVGYYWLSGTVINRSSSDTFVVDASGSVFIMVSDIWDNEERWKPLDYVLAQLIIRVTA